MTANLMNDSVTPFPTECGHQFRPAQITWKLHPGFLPSSVKQPFLLSRPSCHGRTVTPDHNPACSGAICGLLSAHHSPNIAANISNVDDACDSVTFPSFLTHSGLLRNAQVTQPKCRASCRSAEILSYDWLRKSSQVRPSPLGASETLEPSRISPASAFPHQGSSASFVCSAGLRVVHSPIGTRSSRSVFRSS